MKSAAPPACPIPKSREEAESLLGELARETNRLQNYSASLEKVILDARAGFQPKIDGCALVIVSQRLALQSWAEANPAEFTDKKSLELLHGTIGFRLSPPALVLRAKMTWAKVLDRLQAGYYNYVRKKEEPDKKQILADASAGKLENQDLVKMGLMLDQQENFFVDLKEL